MSDITRFIDDQFAQYYENHGTDDSLGIYSDHGDHGDSMDSRESNDLDLGLAIEGSKATDKNKVRKVAKSIAKDKARVGVVQLSSEEVEEYTRYAKEVLGYEPIQLPKLAQDLTGKTFGRLTVLFPAKNREFRRIYWCCRCFCGSYKLIASSELVQGNTVSCGCFRIERITEVLGEDITGKVFNNLTVLYRTELKSQTGSRLWCCRCSCGEIIYTTHSVLRTGAKRSCGCQSKRELLQEKIVGRKFGNLFVLGPDRVDFNGIRYKCLCDCGNIVSVMGARIFNGSAVSCGDKQMDHTVKPLTIKESTNTELYHIWSHIFVKCNSKSGFNYGPWGSFGINFCSEWNDVRVFYDWAIVNGYKKGLVLDRLNPFNEFSPSNCRWVTRDEYEANLIHYWVEILLDSYVPVLQQTVLPEHQKIIQFLTKPLFRNEYWDYTLFYYTGNRINIQNENRLKQYIKDYLTSVYRLYEYTLAHKVFNFEKESIEYPILSWTTELQPNLSCDDCSLRIEEISKTGNSIKYKELLKNYIELHESNKDLPLVR